VKRIDQKKRRKKWKEKVVGFEQHGKHDRYHPDRKIGNIVVSYMPQRKRKQSLEWRITKLESLIRAKHDKL